MALIKARTEFASALNQVCSDHGIQPEAVLASVKEAMLAAFKRDFGIEEGMEYEVELDPDNGKMKIWTWEAEKVVDGEGEKAASISESSGEPREESKKSAKKKIKKDVTPPGYGRIAATVAKQVLLQKIREAEKETILKEYEGRIGGLVNGLVLRFDQGSAIIEIGKVEALMPPEEQIRSEKYQIGQRMTFYVVEIRDTFKGKQIIVSRAHRGLVEMLFKREVPEVGSGAVKIKDIAREAGGRTKIAVQSTQPGVDPVGSCVGQKGVRVQAVINELNNEKIDIIQYSDDPAKYVAAALSPAEKVQAVLDEENKTAVVTAPEDQLSLAIGKEGQNVRLAVKLTGYKIEIKGSGIKKDPTSLAETNELRGASTEDTVDTKDAVIQETKEEKSTDIKPEAPEEIENTKNE